MPVEFAIWRLDGAPTRLDASPMPAESELEDLLASDISILGLDILVIGRQVITAYGKKIDLLGIDVEGMLYVIELKRDKTPREVVAQALDYAVWVQTLSFEDIAVVAQLHMAGPLEQAFAERFGRALPEVLNQEHKMVIVASQLDASTERIVTYLSSSYGVPLNVLFFRHFVDSDRRYLARTWLVEPAQAELQSRAASKAGVEPWNGVDYYVAFGESEHRSWDDARRFGFVSGGGGKWYRQTLEKLQPGDRVFVHIPNSGYVGVGEVSAPAVPVSAAVVDVGGVLKPLLEAGLAARDMGEFAGDLDKEERVVAVTWERTVPREQAIWEQGMFANQNTACALRSSFTRERVLAGLRLE